MILCKFSGTRESKEGWGASPRGYFLAATQSSIFDSSGFGFGDFGAQGHFTSVNK